MSQDVIETMAKKILSHEDRISALEAEADVQPVIHQINEKLGTLALAALHQSGLVDLSMDQDGKIEAQILSEEERAHRDTPTPRRVPGRASTLMGDGGPLQWVLLPPAPYNDVEIVCSPDGGSDIGMRCYAIKKAIGGERKKYNLYPEFME